MGDSRGLRGATALALFALTAAACTIGRLPPPLTADQRMTQALDDEASLSVARFDSASAQGVWLSVADRRPNRQCETARSDLLELCELARAMCALADRHPEHEGLPARCVNGSRQCDDGTLTLDEWCERGVTREAGE